MSKEKSALELMLEQYEQNNKPKYAKSETAKVYDLKNYFNTQLKDGVREGIKEVRLLPSKNGSPIVEYYGHKVQVDGEWKTFACLKHTNNEACPFCEAHDALRATGNESDKELSKKYWARLMYVVKLIDRNAEHEGVKFWRFNHNYKKEGVFDKIQGILVSLKKDRDVTNPVNGRDLTIVIGRDTKNNSVVTNITAQDVTPLTEDKQKLNDWLSDERTWKDVYSIKSYDYLEIIVRGGVPVWDSTSKKFVDKAALKQDFNTKEEPEINIGLETVKANIKEATKTVEKSAEVEEEDGLPF